MKEFWRKYEQEFRVLFFMTRGVYYSAMRRD